MSDWKEAAQNRAARMMLAHAPRHLRKVFGEPSRNERGDVLDVRMHVLMRLIALNGEGGLYRYDVAQARAMYDRAVMEMTARQDPLPIERDIMFDGPAGKIPATLYQHGDDEPSGLCVFFHGGGFTVGRARAYADVARRIAWQTGSAVCNVEYRLAPEHRLPAGYEDAFAAYRGVRERAGELGVDASRIWVAGDSAGGALATGVVQMCLARGEELPRCQLLYYPVTNPGSDWPSRREFAEGFFLTRRDIGYFERHASGGERVKDAPGNLLHAPESWIRGQCPAVIVTAGFDPLRDEGEAYAARLKAEGVEVELMRRGGLVHGFVTMTGWLPEEAGPGVDDALGRVKGIL